MNKLTQDPRLPICLGDAYQKSLNARLYEVLRDIVTQLNLLIDGNCTQVTTAEKNVLPATAGMEIFDTTLGKRCVYTGTAWQTITST